MNSAIQKIEENVIFVDFKANRILTKEDMEVITTRIDEVRDHMSLAELDGDSHAVQAFQKEIDMHFERLEASFAREEKRYQNKK